eukprot:6482269-Amphidinium_carterae.1
MAMKRLGWQDARLRDRLQGVGLACRAIPAGLATYDHNQNCSSKTIVLKALSAKMPPNSCIQHINQHLPSACAR